jgi:hypothetical protein
VATGSEKPRRGRNAVAKWLRLVSERFPGHGGRRIARMACCLCLSVLGAQVRLEHENDWWNGRDSGGRGLGSGRYVSAGAAIPGQKQCCEIAMSP